MVPVEGVSPVPVVTTTWSGPVTTPPTNRTPNPETALASCLASGSCVGSGTGGGGGSCGGGGGGGTTVDCCAAAGLPISNATTKADRTSDVDGRMTTPLLILVGSL